MAAWLAGTQWRRNIMMGLLGAMLGLFCAVARTEQAAPEPFEVGQRWEYRHEGPRPGSVEPNAIDGERILHVIAAVDRPEGPHWVIEEQFTGSPEVTGRVHVNRERMLCVLEIENQKKEVAALRYDPPIPYQTTDLEVGGRRKLETTLRMDGADFALPNTMVVERLGDETITTPAGEFVGCSHYRTTSTSTFDIKIAKVPITEERERWYHPCVNGMVKEVYRRQPVRFLTWSRPGYTATSVLTAFGHAEPTAATGPATRDDTSTRPGDERDGSRREAPKPGKTCLILLGLIVVLAAAGLFAAKRARNAGRKS